jgi:dTDP-4-dehydrorhamnose reductase
LENIRVLIAGASGLVGGNCFRYFSAQPGITVKGTHYSYPTAYTSFYDTLHPDNPDNFKLDEFRPTHIIHAGALTHVDYCEQHPEESAKLTVSSTIKLSEAALRHNAQLIYISTDYVFDGLAGPYDESAQLNPLCVYGWHKLAAEELIRENHSDHLILRITNVYGDEERNKNFVARLMLAGLNREQLKLRLPYDQYATPISAMDVAKALYLLIRDRKDGLYHLAGTDYLNRVQLARKVMSHFPKHKVEIEPVSTAELNQPARRPLEGGLKAHKFLYEYPDFEFSGVDTYLHGKLKPVL